MVLEQKKALVTGASRGIGRAISEAFLNEGAEVWGVSTKEPADLAARQDAAKGRLHWLCADLSHLDEVEALAEKALKESGGFAILVNNAGITRDNLSFRMNLADFQKVLDVNLTAGFLLSRVICRDMIHRRAGSVINMASVVGLHGNGGQANYAASKAGVVAITKTLAQEVASRGVRVNAIAPGFIESDMTAAMTDDAKKKTLEHIPLRRMGKPGDVAAAVLFLAQDASAYITGQVIPVDGGMFM